VRIVLLVASALIGAPLLGCGGDDSKGTVDVSDIAEPNDSTDQDVDVPNDDVIPDDLKNPSDTAETVDPLDVEDAEDTAATKPRGTPCSENAECDSGFCLGSPGVCAITCADDDPCEDEALTCLPLADVSVCASRNDIAGLPCNEAADCLAGSTCVALSDEVSRCVFACTGGCDQGYACDDANDTCAPPGGFDCSLFDAAAGRTGTCTDTNVNGTCSGGYTCNGAGAGSCSAPPAAMEICDGEDNDCDSATDEGLCDDSNPCTDDRCDPANVGQCLNEGVAARACDDGDTCTTGDQCTAAGECAGTGSCQCQVASDCPLPAGRHGDCMAVACEGTPAVCVYTNRNAGGTCTSTVACLTNGVCGPAGRCTGQTTTCDDGKVCTTDVCNPDGTCSATALPVGTSCSDSNACTTGDACVSGGLCLSSGTLECNDGNGCTSDSCNATSGCLNINNTAPCNDGVLCTINDVCSGGSCGGTTLNCTSLNTTCARGTCTPTGCVATPTAGSCSDNNPCTFGDRCDAGACVATELDCSELDTACADATCSAGTCQPPTTACTFTARFHLVSAAFNYTPNDGSHWVQASVGHASPVGPAANPIGFAVYWGFHADGNTTPVP